MKSQLRKITSLVAVAALSLAAITFATAKPVNACAPTRFGMMMPCDPCASGKIAAQMSCDPCAPTSITSQGSCSTPVPPDPCAPTSIRAMGMDCSTPEPVVEEPAPVVATPAPIDYDENVSFNDTDLGVSLFKSEDANGNTQMDLYRTSTGSSSATYLFSITQEDIAPFVAEHPAKNTLLASAEGVEVYVLTTGEIQINAGPDAEGKTHVKIFDGIPWTHVYGYTIDAK